MNGKHFPGPSGLPCMRPFLMLVAARAYACPVCNSGTGQQVRESILGPDFGFNLAAALAPFALCALVIRFLPGGDPR